MDSFKPGDVFYYFTVQRVLGAGYHGHKDPRGEGSSLMGEDGEGNDGERSQDDSGVVRGGGVRHVVKQAEGNPRGEQYQRRE